MWTRPHPDGQQSGRSTGDPRRATVSGNRSRRSTDDQPLNHVNVFVLDQERAKAFYTETLGFELRNDADLDGFRWLTVGPRTRRT